MMLNPIQSKPELFRNINQSLYQELQQLRRENATLKHWIAIINQTDPHPLKLEASPLEWEISDSDVIVNFVSDRLLDEIILDLSINPLTNGDRHRFPLPINFYQNCGLNSSTGRSSPSRTENLSCRTLALKKIINQCQSTQNPDHFPSLIQNIRETAIDTLKAVQQINFYFHPSTQLPGLDCALNELITWVNDFSSLNSGEPLKQFNLPIFRGENQIGLMGVESQLNAEWTEEDQSFLESVAHLISLTLERLTRQQQQQQLAAENAQLSAQLHTTRQHLASQTAKCHKLEFALEKAQNTAQTALRAKRTFLANISHELRTPIHAIIGYSDLLCEEILEQGQINWVEDVEIIRREGYRLLHLIDSILDLVRIEAGQMSLHPDIFDPVNVVEGVVHSLKPIAEKNHNQVQVHYGPNLGLMQTDFGKLQKILHHLLENAVKFTQGGHIDLTVCRQGDWIEFTLTDTGIGISVEHQHCLFEAFTQADDSLCRKYGGTGLGLTLCRHLCQMMGGDITVSSQLGQGSTFTVRLKAMVQQALEYRAG
ncbi:sensor histidine kinase [Capilliphycus salinus ALCB114379]|uniref:sensor histidine kinase n=1 Tax=Capilliphycus salinus TaxID=2768948 RepID=UPI0039A74140